MTLITEELTNIGLAKARGMLSFFAPRYRDNGPGTGMTVPTRFDVPIVDGGISVELDPGPAQVQLNGILVSFTVPANGSHRLWTLIEAQVAIPPNTGQGDLLAAISSYFAANPVEGGSGFVVDPEDPDYAIASN